MRRHVSKKTRRGYLFFEKGIEKWTACIEHMLFNLATNCLQLEQGHTTGNLGLLRKCISLLAEITLL